MRKSAKSCGRSALTQKISFQLPLFLSALIGSVVSHAPTLAAPQSRAALEPAVALSSTSAPMVSAADRRLIQQLLKEAQAYPTLGARMNVISARLLGRAYLTHPLIGSPTQPEQFVTRMDGFDCVTYLETVLALAGARDVESYLQRLRTLRYEGGDISYATRLHYTMSWHRVNTQRGFLQDVTAGEAAVERTKTLSMLRDIAPQTETFRYYPKARLNAVTRWMQNGDLIYFASGRKGLDTNHAGMLFRVGDQWMLRHASRRRGQVVEQPVAEFCQQNRMSGFILARPIG